MIHSFAHQQTVKKATWIVPQHVDTQHIKDVSDIHQIQPIISEILIRRNIKDIETFLQPKLKKLLPNPSTFMDMDRGVAVIGRQILSKQPIGIFGDYDVDGATSASLLIQYFKHLSHPCAFHIPHRITEGYGVSSYGLDCLKKQDCDTVITVDCGTLSHEALAYGCSISQQIVVLDHHQSCAHKPPCVALINPNQKGEQSEFTYLCAAGLVFIFLVGLNRFLKQAGYFKNNKAPELLSFLDLVALGTVCDVVPLTGLNRAYVVQGLKVMTKWPNLGLHALARLTHLHSPITPYHLGFILGPRINAGGRIDDPSLGVKLLTCNNQKEANHLAQKLDQANTLRKQIETSAIEDAQEQILSTQKALSPVLLCQSERWHPGIIGLVASRIKEQFHRPTIALTFYEDSQIGKGSARSIDGYEIGMNFHEAMTKGLLITGGGHPKAGGLTIKKENVSTFHQFMIARAEKLDITPCFHPVAQLSLQAITGDFLTTLDKMQPFGMGNPTPKFLFQDVILSSVQKLGAGHLKAWIQDYGGKGIQLLVFRPSASLINFFDKAKGQLVHIIGSVQCSIWKERKTLQIILDDITLAEQTPKQIETLQTVK